MGPEVGPSPAGAGAGVAPVPHGPDVGIDVVRATRTLDGLTVLADVSFSARAGEVTALLGPNGAGKSTLLRALAGLERLDDGRAQVHGRLGALLSPDAVHPRRTVRDHLRVLAVASGHSATRVDRALELVGLQALAREPAGRLSLGMRQRLAIATALLPDPEVVVLDEPHNGLDAHAIGWLRGALRHLADDGRAVLLSSHLLGEVAQVADRVVVLHEGRVLADEPIADFARADGASADRTPAALAVGVERRYLGLVA